MEVNLLSKLELISKSASLPRQFVVSRTRLDDALRRQLHHPVSTVSASRTSFPVVEAQGAGKNKLNYDEVSKGKQKRAVKRKYANDGH